MKKKDIFSVADEPALGGVKTFTPDPAETRAKGFEEKADTLEIMRDSVFSEPVFADGEANFIDRITGKAREISFSRRFIVTLLAAVIGGLLAIPGTIFSTSPGWGGAFYAVLIGPMLEEFFKQSGMLYLLEKKPFYITARWQFLLIALFGGLFFGVLENLVYGHIYLRHLPPEELANIMEFRWLICTALHVCCSVIASFGLYHAWKRSAAEKRLFTFQYAWCYFGIAVAVHGLYNLCVSLIDIF